MIKIAVIGDIGSGKSFVAKQFGFPVFNADFEVKKIYKKNKKCYQKLKKILPSYIKNFPINKSRLVDAILANNENIVKIGKIVHPEVRNRMNNFLKENKKKKFVVLDIPLLLENKINKKGDVIIFVDAKKKAINRRLKKRRNFNPKIVKKLRKLQLPLEVKKKKSNFIVKNNFKNNSVKKNVKRIIKEILLNA